MFFQKFPFFSNSVFAAISTRLQCSYGKNLCTASTTGYLIFRWKILRFFLGMNQKLKGKLLVRECQSPNFGKKRFPNFHVAWQSSTRSPTKNGHLPRATIVSVFPLKITFFSIFSPPTHQHSFVLYEI